MANVTFDCQWQEAMAELNEQVHIEDHTLGLEEGEEPAPPPLDSLPFLTSLPTQNMKMGAGLGGVPEIFVPTGCKKCLRTGFVGRRALFELLEVTDAMRDLIMKTPTIQGIREIANQGLFTSLEGYGFQLVSEGETTFDEIDRVAGSEG